MFGIEPTHREELRRKQGIRLVAEESLVNLGELFSMSLYKMCDGIDLGWSLVKRTKKLKKYLPIILAFAFLTFAMVL